MQPPFLDLYHGGGVSLPVRPRVNCTRFRFCHSINTMYYLLREYSCYSYSKNNVSAMFGVLY